MDRSLAYPYLAGGDMILIREKKTLRQSVIFALTALMYAIVANYFVKPLAMNWGADYSVYISAINNVYYFERLNVLFSSGSILGFIHDAQVLPFYFIVFTLSGFGLDAHTTLSIVSITSALVISFYVLQKSKNKFFLVFLFSPMLLEILFFQVRNGFALALFFAGLLIVNKFPKVSYFFFILSLLFHHSLVLLIIIYLIVKKTQQIKIKNYTINRAIWLNIFIGVFLVVLYSIFYELFSRSYFRASIFTDSSVIGFLFFIGIVILYIVGGSSFIWRFQFQFLFSIILLCLYPIFTQILRLYALSFPFHIIAFSKAPNKVLPFFVLLALVIFNFLNWQTLLFYIGN